MKNKAFTLQEVLVVLMGLAALSVVLLPVFSRARQSDANSRTCVANLRQIGLGFKQYIQDYDERFPIIKGAGKQGWMHNLQPYLKSTRIFQCPSDSLDELDGTSDYFYNSRLSGLPESQIINPGSTIANGDGPGNAPTKANISKLPPHWSLTSSSPARRHQNGANYAYSDGHVEWHRPPSITTKRPADGISTFLTK